MTAQMSLPVCVLPGCANIVADPSTPCTECLAAFGDWLRESDRPAPTQAEIAERDDRYREVMAERARLRAESEAAAERQIAIESGERRKPNQLCWLCEDRRACTYVAGRWECDTCREVS
jgi:hypothetical protein